MTEETIRLNREDLKDLKEKGYITRERIADNNKKVKHKQKLIENGSKFGRLTVLGLDHINEYVDSKG